MTGSISATELEEKNFHNPEVASVKRRGIIHSNQGEV